VRVASSAATQKRLMLLLATHLLVMLLESSSASLLALVVITVVLERRHAARVVIAAALLLLRLHRTIWIGRTVSTALIKLVHIVTHIVGLGTVSSVLLRIKLVLVLTAIVAVPVVALGGVIAPTLLRLIVIRRVSSTLAHHPLLLIKATTAKLSTISVTITTSMGLTHLVGLLTVE
jgi:hypothetical protein